MKYLLILISSLIFLNSCENQPPVSVSSPDGYVTDAGGMLSDEEEEKLEEKLKNYESETSNQIAILTIESLEGKVLEEYAIEIARKWGVGQKDKDNGILILISKNDRKIRIEVGFGLEGTMTDMMSGRVIDNKMKPAFKDNDYYKGIDEGTSLIFDIISGEYTQENVDKEEKKSFFFILIIPFIVVIAILGAIHPLASAIGGSIIGGITGFLIGGVYGAIIGGIIGFIIGLIIGVIAQSSGFGDGGGYSGGGSSSFGSSGGGFSFGGGSFGGGGASGGW